VKNFAPATEGRLYRLTRGIRLAKAADVAGLSLARASEIERHPVRARRNELERLRAAIDRLATEAFTLDTGFADTEKGRGG
jgi:hypothetical protein